MIALLAHDPTALDVLPIRAIMPSRTGIQQLRRAHFDPEKLIELAESIRQNGVLQPVLVRPIPRDSAPDIEYELVAGERRWLAADRAGLTHIPANIRELSDAQVLEAQLVENLQREDLQVLEEAAGYQELMQCKNITADEVAHLIGKSRSYVYARLKLLDLCPAARDALQSGALDASRALLIARIRGDKLQAKALKLVLEKGRWYSYRRLVATLHHDFMIPLADAPFALDDDALMPSGKPALPPCLECPHFSGNDPDLRRELAAAASQPKGGDGDAHVCTDRACYDLKIKLFWARARRDAEAAGRTILPSSEASAVIPGKYEIMKGGYLNLDARADIDFPEPEPETTGDDAADRAAYAAWEQRYAAWEPPTFRQVLAETLSQTQTLLAEARDGRLVELVPYKAVAKTLKSKGIEIPRWKLQGTDADDGEAARPDPAQEAVARAQEEERRKTELEFRDRLFEAIFLKWKGPLKRADFERIAEALGLHEQYVPGVSRLRAAHGGNYDIAKLNDAELQRLIALFPLAREAEKLHLKPSTLLEVAQRLNVDTKKIRAAVIQDLKPVSAAKETAKPATKKVKRKK